MYQPYSSDISMFSNDTPTGTVDYATRLKDPKHIGAGVWFLIHMKAKDATTHSKKVEFVEFVRWIVAIFTCGDCVRHMRSYLESNPIEPYFKVKSTKGQEIGCFRWSWAFHNAVNVRLGKPIMDWDVAKRTYYDAKSLVCKAGCGEGGEEEERPHHKEKDHRHAGREAKLVVEGGRIMVPTSGRLRLLAKNT
jgi:Erv1 / Alr family